MKKKMLSGLVGVLCTTMFMTIPATAVEPILQNTQLFYNNQDTSSIKQTITELKKYQSERTKEPSYNFKIIELLNSLKNNGQMYIDSNGHICLTNNLDDSITESSDFQLLVKYIPIWNYLFDLQLLDLDFNTMKFSTPEITDELIEYVSQKQLETNLEFQANISSRASTHGCGLTFWSVDVLCRRNYDEIETIFDTFAATTPSTAYEATIGYWIGKVKNNGAWDYKVQPDYKGKTFCTSYGGQRYIHQTAEWIGNYNYGYTGEFLFSLNILHFGSSAVAGFDPKDEETDWPAIDEGFYDAQEIE